MRITPFFCGLSIFLLTACFGQPQTPQTPQATEVPTASPTPTPIDPNATPSPTAQPGKAQILSTAELRLKVGEELMLTGEVILANGQKVNFNQFTGLGIDNPHPQLLQLNQSQRIIKGLAIGEAELQLFLTQTPETRFKVRVKIEASAIDPNTAIVNVEIQ